MADLLNPKLSDEECVARILRVFPTLMYEQIFAEAKAYGFDLTVPEAKSICKPGEELRGAFDRIGTVPAICHERSRSTKTFAQRFRIASRHRNLDHPSDLGVSVRCGNVTK
jgi:hypothetical protein